MFNTHIFLESINKIGLTKSQKQSVAKIASACMEGAFDADELLMDQEDALNKNMHIGTGKANGAAKPFTLSDFKNLNLFEGDVIIESDDRVISSSWEKFIESKQFDTFKDRVIKHLTTDESNSLRIDIR